MNIREREEAFERERLSPFACLASESCGRTLYEEESDVRTCFMHDRDSIIHSKSFRRLEHKTQVFIAPEGDHYRTRMTHTLEVSGIARTIARALMLNEDLTEAIALGHDLGHTPFGHGGERELSALTGGRFVHAEQSVRVVDRIENCGKGLNLTFEVKNGIACHSGDSRAQTLEGRVVALSDRIAYINHDIDDAIRAGILRSEDIPREYREILGETHGKRINTLVTDTISESLGKPDILMSDDVHEAMLGLRTFMFENVYRAEYALIQEKKVRDMISRMFEYYIGDTERLPAEYRRIAETDGDSFAVCDYIAGMTDRYARTEYKELFLPASWGKI